MDLGVFGGLAGIGVLAAGFGFAYAQFKSGAGKAKDDLITTLKETADVEREKAQRLNEEKNTLMISHQQQITALTEKIGKLQGLYEAAENRNKQMEDILQGRSPEQLKFMEQMTTVADQGGKYMHESRVILQDIKNFMTVINGQLAKAILINETKV